MTSDIWYKNQFLRALSALFFCTLQACTMAPNDTEHRHPGETYEGDLVKLLNEFYNPAKDYWLYKTCDLDLKDQKYEMAQFLEKNRDVISQIPTPLAKNSDCSVNYCPIICKFITVPKGSLEILGNLPRTMVGPIFIKCIKT